MINKLRLFLSHSPKTQLLFVEAILFLGWARILKEKPFEQVANVLMLSQDKHDDSGDFLNKKSIRKVASAVNIMSRYTFWESMCLVKAIAAMKMLERRKIGSTLYLGTARDEEGKLIAHAWLMCGPYYVTGVEEMKRFTVVGVFSNKLEKGGAYE